MPEYPPLPLTLLQLMMMYYVLASSNLCTALITLTMLSLRSGGQVYHCDAWGLKKTIQEKHC